MQKRPRLTMISKHDLEVIKNRSSLALSISMISGLLSVTALLICLGKLFV